MKIMAIDYGDAHTGIAISDPTGFLAGVTTTIHSRKAEVVLSELERLVKEHQVDQLVMGFPRNMDGTEGPRAKLYRDFARPGGPGHRSGAGIVGRAAHHRWMPTAYWPRGQNAKKRKKTVDDGGRFADFRGISGFSADENR